MVPIVGIPAGVIHVCHSGFVGTAPIASELGGFDDGNDEFDNDEFDNDDGSFSGRACEWGVDFPGGEASLGLTLNPPLSANNPAVAASEMEVTTRAATVIG